MTGAVSSWRLFGLQPVFFELEFSSAASSGFNLSFSSWHFVEPPLRASTCLFRAGILLSHATVEVALFELINHVPLTELFNYGTRLSIAVFAISKLFWVGNKN